MKALIFGITGQDGHYLSNLLQQQNIEVIVNRGTIAFTKFEERLIIKCLLKF